MENEETSRPCKRCNGSGVYLPGTNHESKCSWCARRGVQGYYDRPDYNAIVLALIAKKGKCKGGIRASAPIYHMGNLFECRVYYVWRLFRFHAGYDVTMPMTAGFLIESDPWETELESVAAQIAFKVTGRKVSVGSVRWGRALGTVSDAQVAAMGPLPDSASEGGPVADEFKPAEEVAELGKMR